MNIKRSFSKTITDNSEIKDQRRLISTYKGCKIFQENQKGEDCLVAHDPIGNIVAWRFGVDSNNLKQVIRDIESFDK